LSLHYHHRYHLKKVAIAAKSYTRSTVVLNGIPYTVSIDGNSANVNGKVYVFEAKAAPEEAPPPTPQLHTKATITTPLPGLIVRIDKKVGDMVTIGDVVVVIESMKMETALTAPVDGKITSVHVLLQQQVPTGTIVAEIN
jgi:biotin carboxyl carrier protein